MQTLTVVDSGFALSSSRLVLKDVQGGTLHDIVHPTMLSSETPQQAYDMLRKAAEDVLKQPWSTAVSMCKTAAEESHHRDAG